MPAPNTNTSVGMMSSPPATPSKLLTKPMKTPKQAATARRRRSGGAFRQEAWDLAGQKRLHDERRPDPHQQYQDEALQQDF